MESFVVHKELVCHYSSFFRSATQGRWLEAQTGVVELLDDIPEIVALFQTWLYAQKLELDEGQRKTCRLLVEIFIFGDKMGAPGFQNAAIDELSQRSMNVYPVPGATIVKRVYDGTMPGSPLRKLLVDFFPWGPWGTSSFTVEFMESYPQRFLAELVQRLQPTKAKRLIQVDSTLYYV